MRLLKLVKMLSNVGFQYILVKNDSPYFVMLTSRNDSWLTFSAAIVNLILNMATVCKLLEQFCLFDTTK